MSVDEGVVVSAEETEVFETGFASVGPGDDVVDVTPSGFAFTAFPYTVTVSGDDGSAETGGDDPGFASYVEEFGFGAENDSAYRCVAGELADCFNVENMTVLGFV